MATGMKSEIPSTKLTAAAPVALGEGINILLIGDSGSGKTVFAGTCPRPFIFDFDKGTRSLETMGLPHDKATFKELPKNSSMKGPSLYPYGSAWGAFIKKLNDIGESMDKGTCPYQTLVFDSLTTLSNIALNFILNSVGRDKPQIQDWGDQIRALEMVVDQLTAWPLIKVMTAHIQRDKNELTGEIEKLPLVTGKFAGKIPVYFDEVYYTSPERVPNQEIKYYLQTRSDNVTKQAKSRAGVPNKVLAQWSSIEQYVIRTRAD